MYFAHVARLPDDSVIRQSVCAFQHNFVNTCLQKEAGAANDTVGIHIAEKRATSL